MHSGGVRFLHATLPPLAGLAVALILGGCASAPPADPLPYRIEVQDAGLGESFRGASFGVGGRMWSSGTSGTVLHRGGPREGWSQAQLPSAGDRDLRDIDVRLDGQVFAMAAGTGPDSALYRSEGAVGNWQQVLANPDAEGFFDSLAFDSAGVGLLVGDPLRGSFTFFRSRDGQSWQRLERARCPTAAEGEYAFAASGSILLATAPNEFWFATGGSASHIWHTESAGDVWFDTSAPEVGGGPSQGWFGLGHDGRGTLIAVGGDYAAPQQSSTFAVLREGTASWETGTLPGFRSAVQAVPGRPGYWVAVGSHGADWSADGGSSWQPLEIPGGHALAPAGPSAVLVVGGPEQPHRIVRFLD